MSFEWSAIKIYPSESIAGLSDISRQNSTDSDSSGKAFTVDCAFKVLKICLSIHYFKPSFNVDFQRPEKRLLADTAFFLP